MFGTFADAMPETVRIKSRGKVFRDPVHRLIRVEPGDDFILDLIDTAVFQRLRRIRQLGVSWLTYHGAEHSRFSHSMGVFNFAQRILRSLRDRYKADSGLTEYLRSHEKELKAAALLHDIGHAPFSHMLERAFEGTHDHEEQTVRLIREDEKIGEILEGGGVDRERVAEIIEGTSSHRLIVDIVSSQLDADRMDYLLRDSLHTGVEYGRYDAEWIVRNLCIGHDPAARGDVDAHEFGRYRLCMDRDRGMHSAEQLILARLHMTMQVYMHRVTRGYEVLLLNLFRLARRVAQEEQLPPATPTVVKRFFAANDELSAEEWLRFDETAMFAAIAAWTEAEGESNDLAQIRTMASAFLRRERLYKARAIDRNRFGLTGWQRLSKSLEKIGRQGIDWELDEGEVTQYKGLLFAASRPRGDKEEQSAESILLASGEIGDHATPVETQSHIFQSLDFKGQAVCRVYYDRDKASTIEPVLEEHGITASS